jgi:pimeloyl-ACP methyl ester carboxylesterase
MVDVGSLISDDVNANGTNIHHYRTGGAKPPLVLLHGITDSGLCWPDWCDTSVTSTIW